MIPVPATVAALLDVARGLVVEQRFDVEQALHLLASLPMDELDVQTRGAIKHAQLVAAAARTSSTTTSAVARFALHRVVVLLERHLTGLGIN